MRIAAAILIFGSTAVVGTTAALAEPPTTVELIYVVGPGAEGCPAEDAMRAGVSARLGRDPFRSHADTVVHATFARSGSRLVGRVEVDAADGRSLGKREMASEQNDCAELGASMGLAIAIAVDPVAAMGTPPIAPPPPVVAPSPPVALPPPSPVLELPAAPLHLQVAAGALSAIGAGPAMSIGFAVDVAVRREMFSLGLEGRADLQLIIKPAAAA